MAATNPPRLSFDRWAMPPGTPRLGYRDLREIEKLKHSIASALTLDSVRVFAGNADAIRPRSGDVLIPSGNSRYARMSPEEQVAERLYLTIPHSTLSKATQAIALLERQRPYDSLGKAERSALEAIYYVTGRPSLRLKDGAPDQAPPPNWTVLNGHHAAFRRVSGSVGRIDVTDASLSYVGTCAAIGERLILTNRHVAKALRAGSDEDVGTWRLDPDKQARVAFGYEEAGAPGRTATFTDIVYIAREGPIDLAVLATKEAIPPPLEIEKDELDYEEPVYAIGYPAEDPHGDRKIMRRLFGTEFGVKRIAPGRVRDPRDIPASFEPSDVLHDCTTLANSSGSCIISLTSHKIVALHFQGAQFYVNRAVGGRSVADHVARARAKAQAA